MYGPGEPLSLTWLTSERDNLVAVIDRRLGEPRREWAELAVRALLALDHLVAVRGSLRPQLAMFETLLDADAEVHLTPKLRGAALAARGELRRRCGQLPQARADLEAAIELARASGDARLLARSTRTLGVVLCMMGDLAVASRTLEQALGLARAAGDAATEARTLSSLGNALGELDQIDRGGECLTAAANLHRAAGDARAEARTLEDLAVNLLDRGESDAAREQLERALALQHAENAAPTGRSAAGLALLHHLERSLSEAIVHYGDAIRFARALGNRPLEGIHRGYLGMALSEHGSAREAAGHLDAAISLLEAAGERRYLALFRACRAEAATRLGDADVAREMLRGARELVGERQDPLAVATQLHSVATEVADAGATHAASDAQRLIERAERGPMARRSDVRLGLRSAKRALQGRADVRGPSDARPTQDPGALLVHEGGRWFRLPYGPLVRCGDRRVLRRVLVQLANHRLRAPGEPLPFEALLEAGWPGERMRVDAGKNRIRVTLARLRDLGLGPLIQFADGGYLLDPAVTVILSSAKS
jgi:tetratricopeptide (TPR) repeat protein